MGRLAEQLLHVPTEHFDFEGLEQALVGTRRDGQFAYPRLVVAGDAENGGVLQFRVAANQAADLEAIHAGEQQVQNEKVRGEAQKFHACVHSVVRCLEGAIRKRRAQGAHDQVKDGRVIVDYEDFASFLVPLRAAALFEELSQVGFREWPPAVVCAARSLPDFIQ